MLVYQQRSRIIVWFYFISWMSYNKYAKRLHTLIIILLIEEMLRNIFGSQFLWSENAYL